MRAVLYTPDFEPITALTLDAWMIGFMEREGRVTLPVLEEPAVTPAKPEQSVPRPIFRTVTITAEPLRIRGQRHMLLFTQDEESALLLKSVFLPGQRRALREAEDDAMAKGVLRGITAAAQMFRGFHG